jgi:hypothetical protein
MGHYENGRNGGKLPLRFREVFHDAVETFVLWDHLAAPECPEPTVGLDDDHEELTLSRVCGLVWNCTNFMPLEIQAPIAWIASEHIKDIGLSYACGARRLLSLINWRKGREAVALPVLP